MLGKYKKIRNILQYLYLTSTLYLGFQSNLANISFWLLAKYQYLLTSIVIVGNLNPNYFSEWACGRQSYLNTTCDNNTSGWNSVWYYNCHTLSALQFQTIRSASLEFIVTDFGHKKFQIEYCSEKLIVEGGDVIDPVPRHYLYWWWFTPV